MSINSLNLRNGRKKHRTGSSLLYFLLLLIIIVIIVYWWFSSIQPVSLDIHTTKTITIQKGKGLREIAENLKTDGIIRSPAAFLIAVKYLGIDNSIQAGTFYLSPSMDTYTVAKKLTKSTNDIRVTIPEGKRVEEVVAILAENIPNINQDDWEFIFNQDEGYLFPDTYQFSKDCTPDQVIKTMKNNFNTKFNSIQIINNYLSKSEIVILASMIEREARHDEDRQLVSSVIYNRLNIGMKLDIDSTVQYAIGYDYSGRTWWKKRLTATDLANISPYNTYRNPGLPPGPISNPGLTSLQAAANPADTNYLYYFTDSNGINHYSSTYEAHETNIRKYGISN